MCIGLPCLTADLRARQHVKSSEHTQAVHRRSIASHPPATISLAHSPSSNPSNSNPTIPAHPFQIAPSTQGFRGFQSRFQRFSEVFRGFQSRGFQRFSEVFRGFQRFSEVFRGFQRFSEVFRCRFRGFQRFSEAVSEAVSEACSEAYLEAFLEALSDAFSESFLRGLPQRPRCPVRDLPSPL
jgi:hypothetical protein